jgi:hypothetical protein
MRFIRLHKIVSDRTADFYSNNEEGEGGAAVLSTPVSINVESIRCFYPRKENRPGTRITYTDGGGFAVTETYDEVARAVEG